MEKISDLLKNVKERLASPLIFSFILSWLLFNWKVTVGLLWYDADQIKAAGYATFFDFITAYTSCPEVFWIPVACAVGYTLLTPLLKNGLAVFHAWANGIGNTYSFKYSKDSPVKVEMYMKLRDEYKTKEVQVSDLINTETQRNQLYTNREKEIGQLQKEKVDLQTTIQQNKDKIGEQSELLKQKDSNHAQRIEQVMEEYREQIEQCININPITGIWRVTYSDNILDNDDFAADVTISTSTTSTARYGTVDFNYAKGQQSYNIVTFRYWKVERKIFFACISIDGLSRKFFDLQLDSKGNLSGYENDKDVYFHSIF